MIYSGTISKSRRCLLFLFQFLFFSYVLKGQWNIPIAVDNDTDNDGQYTSLAIVSGNPAISYYDQTNNNSDLMYVRALDSAGTIWGTPIAVDADMDDDGRYTSLLVVNGNPAISYHDLTNGNLMYIRADDAIGLSWGDPIAVDNDDDIDGRWISMEIVNGNPAISYQDGTNNDLMYVRASDASGLNWEIPIAVDSDEDADGFTTSLKVIDGHPAISYHDRTNGNLMYVRANDASGLSWSSSISVDNDSDIDGEYSSLQVVNGFPAISYFDDTNDNLNYVRAEDIQGTNWGIPIAVDNDSDRDGWTTSLEIVDGYPAICYYDVTNANLNYVRALDVSGSFWGSVRVVDSDAQNDGLYCSMAIVDGHPAISYWDATNENLNFVRSSTPTGEFPVSVEELDDDLVFDLYPNPVISDELTISLNSTFYSNTIEIKIIDPSGKELHAEILTLKKGLNNIRIPVNELVSGYYFICFIDGTKTYSRKILVLSK